MADEDLTARLRATGQSGFRRAMRGAADETDRVGRNARRAAGGLRLFGAATTSTARGLRLTAGIAGGAAAGGLVAVAVAAKRSVTAFEEKRQIVAQTGAALKSTGGAARVTEGQIDRLSTSLSRMSGVDDETVRQGQNLLLTFRDIRNEKGPGNVFAETTRATLDLSAAMGMDMPQAALQVGKAINDPVRGFKRLQRIGVAFTKTQEDQIKHFDKVGDRAGAQRVILRELTKEFGGSAKAQVTPLKRLRVSWGNIEEAIGGGLAPVVDRLATKFDKFFVKAEPAVGKFGKRLNEIAGRKDLSLERKFTLSAESARNALRPLTTAVGTFWSQNREKIIAGAESAVSSAGGRMADAAAAAAPHAASMFVNAFKNASPWGQLLTVGLLAKKLGVFSTLGGLASSRMCGSIGRTLPGCIESKAAGGGFKGAMSRAGTLMGGPLGRSLGAMAVTGILLEINNGDIRKTIEDALNPTHPAGPKLTNPTQADTPGGVGPRRPGGLQLDPAPDPGPSRRPGGGAIGTPPITHLPGTRGSSATPFARQGAGPRARGRGAALLNVEVPVHLHKREVGRGMARIAADDLAGA